MNLSVFIKQPLAAAVLLGGLVAGYTRAEVVYDNTSGNKGSMYVSQTEYGDEINLAPGLARKAVDFQFTYFSNYDLASGAVIRLYKNNGPTVLGASSPGDLLYQSSVFDIKKSDTSDPNNVLATTTTINLAGTGLVFPDTLTWTVEFSGIGGGNEASALVYDAPTVGTSYSDFWQRNSSGWDLMVFPNGPKGNFNAKLTAVVPTSVPEGGSSLAFLALGVTGVCLIRRRFQS